MMKVNSTKITLSNLNFYAYHGVMEHERKVGNKFQVSLELSFDASKAMTSDDLTHTINYAQVYELICEVMAEPKQLIESVAGSILSRLKSQFPSLTTATCSVTKLAPPIPAFDGSGVTFTATVEW